MSDIERQAGIPEGKIKAYYFVWALLPLIHLSGLFLTYRIVIAVLILSPLFVVLNRKLLVKNVHIALLYNYSLILLNDLCLRRLPGLIEVDERLKAVFAVGFYFNLVVCSLLMGFIIQADNRVAPMSKALSIFTQIAALLISIIVYDRFVSHL